VERRSDAGMTRTGLLLAVYLPAALLLFGQGILLTTLPLYAKSFDVSLGWVGLAVAAAAIGTMLMDVPAGAVVGLLGQRPAMVLGSALVMASTFALGFGHNFVLLVLLRIAAGVGTALWALSRHALLARGVAVARRGRAVSIYGGVNRIGTFAGPLAGGLIGKAYGLQESFFAVSVLAAAALILSLAFVRSEPVPAKRLEHRARWSVVLHLLRKGRRELAAAGGAQIFAQMIRAGRQFLIPIYGATILGLDAAQIGVIMTSAAVLDMLLFLPVGVTMDRFGRKVATVPSFVVMAAGVALIPLTSSYLGLLLASLVIGFGNGLGSGTMMTLGADLAPAGATGEFLGLWRLVGDAGSVGGPLVVGGLAGVAGLRGSAFVLAAIGITAALMFAFLVRETRRAPLDAMT